MTLSLVARCARTGQVGVAALTAMVGVGKLVPYTAPGVGAFASQATLNPYLGIDGLRLLADGLSPQEVLDDVIASDPGRAVRQCGVIDIRGRVAAWTGDRTPDWSGHQEGADVIAQGNRLTGPEVLAAAIEAFGRHEDLDLAERLLMAVDAGEHAGGDAKREQSAALVVNAGEEYPLWDVRVDHSEDPARRLREVYDEMKAQLLPEMLRLPTREDPLGQAARELLKDGPS